MKTFVFHATEHNNGKVDTCIYRLKRNVPQFVGKTTYYNGSSKGHESEVFEYLCEHGYIPKSAYKLSANEWRAAGYYCREVKDAGYQIFGIA